jgi:hypothetical protein
MAFGTVFEVLELHMRNGNAVPGHDTTKTLPLSMPKEEKEEPRNSHAIFL